MREIAIRVTVGAVEQVLDRLLPLVPGGVREVPDGAEVKLLIRGDVLPSRRELEWAVGRFRGTIVERSVPDDWRQRRLVDYEPLVIGERLVVRPEWAPSGIDPSRPELIEIVLGEGVAFGAGTHPTTRACLELLLDLEPRGPFADLGCGTGVLAILAATLGWGPVVAVDLQPASVAAAAEKRPRQRGRGHGPGGERTWIGPRFRRLCRQRAAFGACRPGGRSDDVATRRGAAERLPGGRARARAERLPGGRSARMRGDRTRRPDDRAARNAATRPLPPDFSTSRA